MTDASEAYVRRLVDEGALRAYLADRLGPAERYAVEYHEPGHSNETLFVTWGDRDLVLRRPPPGEVAETAHDVLREYRVLDALQGTDVPVPPTVLACEDDGVLGSDFYVMERVEGAVLRETEPAEFAAPARRRRIGEGVVDTLASIHRVDTAAVGLDDVGHPPGFTERQVERWSRQLMWAFEVTAGEREVPALYSVMEWLEENVPADPPATLVHGDFKPDNLMFGAAERDGSSDERTGDAGEAGTTPRLVAVFDWEMATRGDPRTDLGWLLSHWCDPGDRDSADPVAAASFTAAEGYPTRRELVARWEAATGRSFEAQRFYRALAVYKLCGLGEMFYRRYLEGNGDDPIYPTMAERVPALAERALAIVEGEEPL